MPPTTVVLGDDESQTLANARAGDEVAIAQLYATHRHKGSHLAALLVGDHDAEDLFDEAFLRVVTQLRRGSGPTDNFRAYLATAIRNLHRDQRRRRWREEPVSDQPWLLEEPTVLNEEASEEFDDERASAALASLPDSWRRVVRLVEVDGLSIAEAADLLGLQPAALSALAYRAREGLRTAYLSQFMVGEPSNTQCDWARHRLPRHVRGSLGAATAARVASHLNGCAACRLVLNDLQRINRCFRSMSRASTEEGQARRSSGPTGKNCSVNDGQALVMSSSMSR